jgi:hypothetical protein
VKTLLRTLISLLIILWLGAVLFFPAIAFVAFNILPHPQAGAIVRECLSLLHTEGLVSGTVLLVCLIVASAIRLYGTRLLGPVLCVVIMLLLTSFSQRSILPRMDADLAAVGGNIEKAPGDPHTLDFNRLHNLSEEVEEGVLFAGILLVVLLALPSRNGAPTPEARGSARL